MTDAERLSEGRKRLAGLIQSIIDNYAEPTDEADREPYEVEGVIDADLILEDLRELQRVFGEGA